MNYKFLPVLLICIKLKNTGGWPPFYLDPAQFLSCPRGFIMGGNNDVQQLQKQLDDLRIRMDRQEKSDKFQVRSPVRLCKAILNLPDTFDFESDQPKVSRFASSLGNVSHITYNYNIIATSK